MFLINVAYKKSLHEVDRVLPRHSAYLEQGYHRGIIIVSGRKDPRTGGIILLNVPHRKDAEYFVQQDPFYTEDIADFDIIEFHPTKSHPDFASFLAHNK